jgi:hypothetical protein
MNIKKNFHHLIDSMEDEQLLQRCYQLIQKINDGQNGHLWNDLSEVEKEELLVAYEESFNPNNLLTNEQVKLEHKQWLKP